MSIFRKIILDKIPWSDNMGFKNVKISEKTHEQLKIISNETGIDIWKLADLGIEKIITDYREGFFNNIIAVRKNIRRDGTITRT
jgi:hypothetical protein